MGLPIGFVTSQAVDLPVIPPPGPPFLPTSADNGLSVDLITGTIQLGNDPGLFSAALLNNRELPMGPFSWNWLNGTDRQFRVDPLNTIYALGDIDGGVNGYRLVINDGLQLVTLGCDNGPVDNLAIFLDGQSRRMDVVGQDAALLSSTGLRLDFANDLFQLGDIDQLKNLVVLDVDDAAQQISGRQANSMGLILNFALNLFTLGDAALVAGQTVVLVDDAAQDILLQANNSLAYADNAGNRQLFLLPGGLNQIGDIDNLVDGTKILIDPVRQITLNAGNTNNTNLLIDDVLGEMAFTTDIATPLFQFGIDTLISEPAGNVTRIGAASAVLQLFKPGSGSNLAVFDGAGANGIGIDGGNRFIQTLSGVGNITIKSGLVITGDTTLIHTGTALANGAGASLGTLTNAPAAGNPTKWITIDDNGTPRQIPSW